MADLSAFLDFSLKDKIVAITGAGSGINLAFAQLAHSKGAHVIIADIKLTSEAQDFVDEAQKSSGSPSVIFLKCNATVWKDLRSIFEVSNERFGEVPDVYVAGAGIFEPKFSNFWDDPESDQGYATVDLNVNHPIKLTRLALRALLGAKKQGVVLLLASMAGLGAFYTVPLYTATKHAIVGFGRAMAEAAVLQGVKVVTICPGLVKTPLFTDVPDLQRRYDVGDQSLTASLVAEHMAALVESSEYPGGTVLEVSLAGARVVPLWGAEPPRHNEIQAERIQDVLAPILAVTARERGDVADVLPTAVEAERVDTAVEGSAVKVQVRVSGDD